MVDAGLRPQMPLLSQPRQEAEPRKGVQEEAAKGRESTMIGSSKETSSHVMNLLSYPSSLALA